MRNEKNPNDAHVARGSILIYNRELNYATKDQIKVTNPWRMEKIQYEQI